MKKLYTADFETTTDEEDCRVWAWGVCEIGNTDNVQYGNHIDGFMEFIEKSKSSTFYFHNEKFDGTFIMCWLFEHGFRHVRDRKQEESKTFTTLISDKGQFYSIRIVFKKQGKKSNVVTILDSLKIIPFSVDSIAKSFGLPISKLEIDYTMKREIGHELTTEETEYLINDVKIVAMALQVLFEQGLTKMTQAGNAMFDYKRTVGEKNFSRWFPVPDLHVDKDIRQSYKGGFTYLNPLYKEKDVGSGLVFDVNSLYPWAMRNCALPFGEPVYFDGQYEPDPLYNLYVQMFSCQFELKEGYIPTVQLKNNLAFVPTQYLESSADEDGILQEVTMCMTSVDLELFFEHYHVYNPVYHSGWKFKSTTGLFTEYIDKWSKVKIESKINGNKGMYTLSKLMLNALYGRFALNPKVCSKFPVYDDGKIRYEVPRDNDKRIIYEYREPIYIPVGTFITAWARHKTITSAQKLKDVFVYADTDSLHLDLELPAELQQLSNKELEKLSTADLQKYGLPLPDDFYVNPVELGAWKLESKFSRARFLRQKSYIEDWNTPDTWNTEQYDRELLNITCAGMPSACYQYVTWENFRVGSSFKGKLQPKNVKGGIVLVETDFTIKPA